MVLDAHSLTVLCTRVLVWPQGVATHWSEGLEEFCTGGHGLYRPACIDQHPAPVTGAVCLQYVPGCFYLRSRNCYARRCIHPSPEWLHVSLASACVKWVFIGRLGPRKRCLIVFGCPLEWVVFNRVCSLTSLLMSAKTHGVCGACPVNHTPFLLTTPINIAKYNTRIAKYNTKN